MEKIKMAGQCVCLDMLLRALLFALGAPLLTAGSQVAHGHTATAATSLPDLCHLDHAVFKVWDSHGKCTSCRGVGTGTLVSGVPGTMTSGSVACDGASMASTEGMAASFYTQPFIVEPTVVYNVTYEVQTVGLVATTAYLSGGLYAQFFDKRALFNGTEEATYGDGWYPGLGDHELENTGWVHRTLSFAPPTTARYAMIHLAFAAHETGYTPDRIHGGQAKGKVELRNLKITRTNATNPPPKVQITVPAEAKTMSEAIDMVNSCFHNSALTGNFTVGSDYIISGNLSPDLGFGMFGVRRMGTKAQMETYTRQFYPNGLGTNVSVCNATPAPTHNTLVVQSLWGGVLRCWLHLSAARHAGSMAAWLLPNRWLI